MAIKKNVFHYTLMLAKFAKENIFFSVNLLCTRLIGTKPSNQMNCVFSFIDWIPWNK